MNKKSPVDLLMETASADAELLRKNDAQGDCFSVPRDVDFLLIAPTAERADLVANFIRDHSYGKAEREGEFKVLVIIHMPIEQNILNSVSGFMQCLAVLFDLKYDGWGSVVQRAK